MLIDSKPTTSPGSKSMPVDLRLAEAQIRYKQAHPISRAIRRATPCTSTPTRGGQQSSLLRARLEASSSGVAHAFFHSHHHYMVVINQPAMLTSGDSVPSAPDATSIHQGDMSVSNSPPERDIPLRKNRDFVSWWTGDAISNLGTAISIVALPLLILQINGSVAQAGTITAALTIGLTLSGLPAGIITDHFPRRAVLAIAAAAQALIALTITILAYTRSINIFFLAALAVTQGLAGGLYSAATEPALRRIVPSKQLPTAVARGQAREAAAEATGSAIAGFVFSAARWLPFGIDALSYLVASAAALLIRTPLGPERHTTPLPKRQRDRLKRFAAELHEGLKYTAYSPFLRFYVTFSATSTFALNGLLFLMIVVARATSGHRASSVGLVAAAATLGGLAGALTGPLIIRRISGWVLVLANAWMMVTAAVILSVANSAWQVAVAMVATLFLLQPSNVALFACEVAIVPDEMQGRVGAALRTAGMSLSWVGPPLAGIIADIANLRVACVVLACIFALPALITQFSSIARQIDTLMAGDERSMQGGEHATSPKGKERSLP